MNRYDFLNLSFVEFEELCHDLLEREWNVPLQFFAEGPDDGVDLRGLTTESGPIIVQCKRYKNFKDLYEAMKREIPKLKGREDVRYVLATSVNLSKKQHEKLEKLLAPFLKSPNDIVGNKGINALLRKFPSVENAHFKLWIQGTGVLEKILHSKVVNHSRFEMDSIKGLLKYYVINPSFEQAVTILEQKRFVIISGIPGIGKTTLARILSYHYLANMGYDEFVFLSNSIEEGFSLYKENCKQVFLYDDFLGQSFDERKLERNEDKRLLDFIRRVRQSKDKVLLFTTREYILKDVQQKHELLANADVELSKCIIDLQSYKPLIKARILYQHLYFSGLPPEHLHYFSLPQHYKKVINHPNYSPRIIENVIREECERPSSPQGFHQELISSLDNPFKIWERPFTSQITDLARYIVTIFMTMGTTVFWDDLFKACEAFSHMHGTRYFPGFSKDIFQKAFKEIDGTFLLSQKDARGQRFVQYQSPSVHDFLLLYFENNQDQLIPVIQSAVFTEQLFASFAIDAPDDVKPQSTGSRRIQTTEPLIGVRVQKAITDSITLGSCVLERHSQYKSGALYFKRVENSVYRFLESFSDEFRLGKYSKQVNEFIIRHFQECILLPADVSEESLNSYIFLLKVYKDKLLLNGDEVIAHFHVRMDNLFLIEYHFNDLKDVLPEAFERFIAGPAFKQSIHDMIEAEMDNLEDGYLNTLIGHLEFVRDHYKIDVDKEIIELQDRYDERIGSDDLDGHGGFGVKNNSENTSIDSLFASLQLIS